MSGSCATGGTRRPRTGQAYGHLSQPHPLLGGSMKSWHRCVAGAVASALLVLLAPPWLAQSPGASPAANAPAAHAPETQPSPPAAAESAPPQPAPPATRPLAARAFS